MGTWAYSLGFTTTAGLGEYAKQCIEGKMKLGNTEDVLEAYQVYTPGVKWNGSLFVNQVDGKEIPNYLLVYQDTYVFGKGYMHMTDLEVPEKYRHIKNEPVEESTEETKGE